MHYSRGFPIRVVSGGEVTPCICGHFPQDKAKVKIRKLNDPPKAEAIRDMVRYARNVIEEFRRAKHYKYILDSCGEFACRRSWRGGKREQGVGRRCLSPRQWV